MTRQRLDQTMVERQLARTRSQAANLIKLGKVSVNGIAANKPHQFVGENTKISLSGDEHYVSRAGFKLASVAKDLSLSFAGTTVLDVGSSTGGFTDYSLKHGAKLVYAVDVGTNQLHPSLHGDKRIELHEQTDIRSFKKPNRPIDMVVIDVSFISLREILPEVAKLATKNTQIVAMCKPQFEVGAKQKNKGVIKNDTMRRAILKDFENWLKVHGFYIADKADSQVSGQKGNTERFYLLKSVN